MLKPAQNSRCPKADLCRYPSPKRFCAMRGTSTRQKDINASLVKALGELTREMKRLDDELRRVRRDVQMSRRF